MEIIEVICIALPTGQNLWLRIEDREYPFDYVRKILDKFEQDNPDLEGTDCSYGMITIKMPLDKYIKIGAHCGPGCFDWPVR